MVSKEPPKPPRRPKPRGMQMRWRVPKRYHEVEPRREIYFTFNTDSPSTFEFKFAEMKRLLIEEWERRVAVGATVSREAEIAKARLAKAHGFQPRSMQDLQEDRDLLDLLKRLEHIRAVTPPGAKAPAALVEALLGLEEVPEEDLRDSRRISEVAAHDAKMNPRKSADTNKAAVKRFIAAVGDKLFADISPIDAETFLLALRRDAEMRKRKQGDPAHTIKRRFTSLKGIWTRWAKRAGVRDPNPFSSVEVENPRGGRDSRLGFHRWHLEQIASWRGGHHRTRAQLALMMRTGIGPHELAGLVPADLFMNEPIPYIHIRDNERRTLSKSGSRARRIPIIGLDAAAVRAALVPTYQPRSADKLSAKLNSALRTAGVPISSRLTSYSFRHGFKQALRAADVPLMIQDRLMGHSSETGSAASYGNRSALLSVKRDALAAALPLLGDVDPVDYTMEELPLSARLGG